MSDPHQREAALFEAVLELPPGQRAAHLDRACAGDAALRRRIESLLQAEESPCEFLDQPGRPERHPTLPFTTAPTEEPGDGIGRYRLLERIGEGGGGAVYVAEQREPVRRRVALKIIKLGMDNRSVIARFEAERQALAMMDHPNIAKVLDAGATETGRPYFVMELVRGLKITDFCDEKQLPTNARLDLFIQVCQAVQHAHQKGIIHRDLKPSNILVTVNDGVAVPKVIDFGVAKATGGQVLTDKTIYTAFEQFIGTPAYMSPEQTVLTSLDLDTRSDIYALGVLLYELLTGRTPFDPTELLAVGLDEMRRTIREKEPDRPSTRVSTLPGQDLTTIAQRRGLEPPKLVSELRGDLDWIVMKCLEKDRGRRYETANGLAMDVARHLNDEPVVASPPSWIYRFGKSMRRNRRVFAAGAAVAAALVAGLGVSTWMFLKEQESHRQAVAAQEQARANFLTAREAIDQMFTRAADELEGQPRMTRLRRELLEDALRYYEGFLKERANDPDVQRGSALASLRVGRIYRQLGQHQKSLPPLEQGIAMLEDLSRNRPLDVPDREELIMAHAALGGANASLNAKVGLHLARERKVLGMIEELHREFPAEPRYLRWLASATCSFGHSLALVNRRTEAMEHCRQALVLYEQHRSDFPGEPDPVLLLAHIQHWLGSTLASLHRRDEAEQAYRIAHDLREQQLAANPDDAGLKAQLAHVNRYLAQLLMGKGRWTEATELLQTAARLDAEVLEDFPDFDNHQIAACLTTVILGKAYAGTDRPEEAEAAYRRGIAMWEKIVPDAAAAPVNTGELAKAHFGLGRLLNRRGRRAEAAESFRKALEIEESLQGPPPRTRWSELQLARMLVKCPLPEFQDPERAITLLRRSARILGETSEHLRLMGFAQYRTGDFSGAIESLHRALEASRGGCPNDWLFLSMAYRQHGEPDQAREWYDKAAGGGSGGLRAEAARTLGIEN